jgi:capsular polysaccharide transport system permease protein
MTMHPLKLRDNGGDAGPPTTIDATLRPGRSASRARARQRGGRAIVMSAILLVLAPILGASWFYATMAADQYVSEFKLSVRGPERASDFGGGGGSAVIGGMIADAFVVTELINSRQMVADVSKDIDLRPIFASAKGDWLSRLRLPASQEDLVEHWKKTVAAHFDMLTGIVTVSVRTFSAEESLLIAKAVAKAADQAVFKMSERARQDMVRFADDEVGRAEAKLQTTRLALRDFRIQEQIMDVNKSAAASSDLASKLREELSRMNQELTTMSRYLAASAPQIQVLKTRISSTENEIARMSRSIGEGAPRSSSEPSPTVLAQFESLNAELQIAEKSYASALEGRQKAQANADRRTTYVTLFVEPSLPDAAAYPQRMASVLLVAVMAATAWFLMLLIVSSVRDHLL